MFTTPEEPGKFVPAAAATATSAAMKQYYRLPKTWRKMIAPVAVLLLLLGFVLRPIVVVGEVHQPQGPERVAEEHQHHRPASRVRFPFSQSTRAEASVEAAIKDAGNSTLGFSQILSLNMRVRYDRADAISLQAFLAGLKVTEYPGVEKEDLYPAGLPPSSSMDFWDVTGRIACWRAHANVWAKMIRENLPPVLILESDAAWDVNIRKIMPELNRHFRRLLHNINSTALPNPKWAPKDGSSPKDADDVWQSRHWDILSVGHCFGEGSNKENHTVKYHDPYVAEASELLSHGGQREIYRSTNLVCTTGYAISQTGAAKLLLRGAIDFNQPVDLIIGEMLGREELVGYHMWPPVMAQWRYVSGIGMDARGSQSDINKRGEKEEQDGWPDVWRTFNVWENNPPSSWRFNNSALRMAGHIILGKDAPAK